MFEKAENSVGKDTQDTCYSYQEIIAKDQPDGACTYLFMLNPPTRNPFVASKLLKRWIILSKVPVNRKAKESSAETGTVENSSRIFRQCKYLKETVSK